MIREDFEFNIDYYRSSLSKALPHCSIQAQLEQGGQGIVFHAWHEVAERDLAIKVLAGGAFASLHSARRFRREVEIMSKMHHPNIVQTYDCGVFNGGLWYAMKFIEGIEVSGWQVIEHPTERKCVELFIKVCDALAYAHRAGYIHRDIKPNNIQVDTDDNPFVLDFGLARPIPSEKQDDISAAGHPVGTLNYMSPEQVIGEELLSIQTDIYSLGVVMYEVLSDGEMPYPVDGEVIERRRHIIETEPKPIKVFNPKIDQDLSSIVCKCLEKHPADRYDSMDAVQSDLRNWLAGDAVAARSGNRWYRWKKTARRHKWPLIAASIFVVTLLAGATTTTIMWQRADENAHRAEDHANRAEDLAATYGYALEMGSLAKLGSVARDEDRVEDALVLWLKALELADAAPLQNEEVARMRYEVLHRLAEFHMVDKHPEAARRYCADAIATAGRYADGGDLAWRRRLGFAEILRGRLALADKDYESALTAFTRSVEIRRGLAEHDEDNVSHRVRLAVSLSLTGRAARKLERMDEALRYYVEAYDIRLALYEDDRNSADNALNLANACSQVASWHIAQKSPDQDRQALDWITRAEGRIDEMKTNGQCEDRTRSCRQLSGVLTNNRALVQRRLAVTP